MKSGRKIWVVSELYFPEETSTGHYLTGIAEGLAKRADVSALCAQPTYSNRGRLAPWVEMQNGVAVRRCRSTRFGKDYLPLRLINIATITIAIFWNALLRFRNGDQVLVVTNPPLLPFAILLAAKLRRCEMFLLIHDVYPEAFVAAGFIRENGLLYKMGVAANRWLYVSADRIIVLGRDMAKLVNEKASLKHVQIVENWADVLEVYPCPRNENTYRRKLDLKNERVVIYSGNLGRTHCIETILEAANKIREHTDIHFLIVGEGAKKSKMCQMANDLALPNMTFLPRQPRDNLGELQNAGDIAIISFVPGMTGISVPCRMYNMMGAGAPIIAATSKHDELAQTLIENDAGWVVPPKDSGGLARLITETSDAEVAQKGENARRAAVEKYSYENIMAKYYSLFGLQSPISDCSAGSVPK